MAASHIGPIQDALNPHCLEKGLDIAEAAAKAARAREKTREDAAVRGALPEPSVIDFDAFRAKATARSRKYAAYAEKTRKKVEGAQHSAKLEWLRSGRDSGGFDSFQFGWHNELHEFEQAEEARDVGGDEDLGNVEISAVDVEPVGSVAMEEMD